AVIEFLVKEEIPAAEIHQRLQHAYGDDRHVIMDTRAQKLGIGHGAIQEMIESLGYRKVCARWVPWLLTEDHKGQMLHKLRRALRDKHPGGNINACLTLEAIAKMGWEVLPHPSYSPNLAPSDYHLFRFVKDQLHEQHSETKGGNSESSALVSSDGWNESLQKGNFQTPRTLGEMCTKKWRLYGKIKKGL
ncbi:hypothetical protein B7P43_G08564, partial [Cryptotermes secundus]